VALLADTNSKVVQLTDRGVNISRTLQVVALETVVASMALRLASMDQVPLDRSRTVVVAVAAAGKEEEEEVL
jgi:hypothetical protein